MDAKNQPTVDLFPNSCLWRFCSGSGILGSNRFEEHRRKEKNMNIGAKIRLLRKEKRELAASLTKNGLKRNA